MTRIAVVGGGALGLLIGGKLAASGQPVEIWTRTEEQARLLKAEGVRILHADGTADAVASVKAAAVKDAPPGEDVLAFLAVKQTALEPPLLAALDRAVGRDGAIVALCNGIGHLERLEAALPGRTLMAAVTTEAALKIDARTVRHTGRGTTWFGRAPLLGASPVRLAGPIPEETARTVESCLSQAGFTVFLSNEMTERILRKLLVNAVINPLTALLRVTNGELLATAERRSAMRAVYEETAGILASYGLKASEELWREVIGVCERTAANRSSMLQDALAGRATEIGSINGAVSRLASAIGRASPWNDKLTALVKALSGG